MWSFDSIGAVLLTYAIVIAVAAFLIGLGVSWLF